ncbi:hypothetical protein ACE5IS_07605 [Leptospira wolffii]|uniref:DUF5683 domain-containing protein n=1 Tax=Leptospira wolffii TaxID=409998 RepID=A0ABV5BM92_9LEPT
MSSRVLYISKRIFWILGILLFSVPLFAKEEGVKLEWKPIPDAGGYVVEIKDSRGKITREKTNATQIQVVLPPGTYEHRIGVLNRYGRVSVFSTWIPFDVILSKKPEILAASQSKFLNKDLPDTLEIKGKHFTDGTKITLKDSKGNEIPIKSIEVKDSETIVVTIDKRKAPEGAISLRIENPRNKVAEKDNYLLLAETPEQLAELEEEKSSKVSSSSSFFDFGAAARSAVLPGWGQAYQNKSKLHTFVFPALIIGAGSYAAFQGSTYLSSVHSLDAARSNNILLNAAFLQTGDPTFFNLAFMNYMQISPKYSAASANFGQLEVAIGVVGLFYLVNLLDAGFISGPKQILVEGTNAPVTVSPLFRNVPESERWSSYAGSGSPVLSQRMEFGAQFSW